MILPAISEVGRLAKREESASNSPGRATAAPIHPGCSPVIFHAYRDPPGLRWPLPGRESTEPSHRGEPPSAGLLIRPRARQNSSAQRLNAPIGSFTGATSRLAKRESSPPATIVFHSVGAGVWPGSTTGPGIVDWSASVELARWSVPGVSVDCPPM